MSVNGWLTESPSPADDGLELRTPVSPGARVVSARSPGGALFKKARRVRPPRPERHARAALVKRRGKSQRTARAFGNSIPGVVANALSRLSYLVTINERRDAMAGARAENSRPPVIVGRVRPAGPFPSRDSKKLRPPLARTRSHKGTLINAARPRGEIRSMTWHWQVGYGSAKESKRLAGPARPRAR